MNSSIIIEQPGKGSLAEECMRQYFLKHKLFVVRGIKVQVDASDITDVDLLLYAKTAPFLRTIINVDIKNKKTPQAAERILWSKGLQKGLGLDACITVTTDKSESIREFAQKQGVVLFDGDLLSETIKQFEEDRSRIFEEEFFPQIIDRLDTKKKQWFERLVIAKSRMLESLDFNGCIKWLDDACFFIDEINNSSKEKDKLIRYCYFCCSLLFLGLDFSINHMLFLKTNRLGSILTNGLMYGSIGEFGFKQRVSFASELASYATGKNISTSRLLDDLSKRIRNEGINQVIEFLMKEDVRESFFEIALKFEAAAFDRTFIKPNDLDIFCRSFLTVLLDFKSINRKLFFDKWGN